MPHPGFPLKHQTLDDNTLYVCLHFSADPDKTQEWEQIESLKVGERVWKREMGMHDTSYDGEPVFADYSDVRHCPLTAESRGQTYYLRENGIPIISGSAYIGGWDGGLRPAFSLLQITPALQIQSIMEVTTKGDDPGQTFTPKVLDACMKRIGANVSDIYHTGDPTIWNRSPGTGESHGLYVRRMFGVNIRRSTNVWEVRRSTVYWALLDKLDNGKERYIVDGKHCPVLRKGFQGAYQFEISTRGDTVGAGRILSDPLKNLYSDIHDANQYALIAAKRVIEGRLTIGGGTVRGTPTQNWRRNELGRDL